MCFTNNDPKLETTQLCIHWWMDNKRMWWIQTSTFCSSIQRNRLRIHTTTWVNFTCMMLSERSQTQKATYCFITSMTFWDRQNCRDRKQISSCQELGGRRLVRLQRDMKGFWGWCTVLYTDCSVSYTTVLVKTQELYTKKVKFSVYKLYFRKTDPPPHTPLNMFTNAIEGIAALWERMNRMTSKFFPTPNPMVLWQSASPTSGDLTARVIRVKPALQFLC